MAFPRSAEVSDPPQLDVMVRGAAVAGLADARSVRAELADVHTRDRSADPFGRGAYSYARVGGAHAGAALARPVEGMPFFAGESTAAAGHAGTVHDAPTSGRRAADEVSAALAGGL